MTYQIIIFDTSRQQLGLNCFFELILCYGSIFVWKLLVIFESLFTFLSLNAISLTRRDIYYTFIPKQTTQLLSMGVIRQCFLDDSPQRSHSRSLKGEDTRSATTPKACQPLLREVSKKIKHKEENKLKGGRIIKWGSSSRVEFWKSELPFLFQNFGLALLSCTQISSLDIAWNLVVNSTTDNGREQNV